MTLPKLSFDRTNEEPLYGQLVSALENAMETGELKDGERLPSERSLAEQLGLSRTTVDGSWSRAVWYVATWGAAHLSAPALNPTTPHSHSSRRNKVWWLCPIGQGQDSSIDLRAVL